MRDGGRIVNVSVAVVTAVTVEGKREIVGMDVGTSEDGAFWLAFLQLSERFRLAASMLAEGGPDVLAFTSFPGAHCKQVWSNSTTSGWSAVAT